MTIINDPALSDLVTRERDILTRIAEGGPITDILRDLVLLVERPTNGSMSASVLFVSPDGKRLLEGAAPSLPKEYNDAINGIAIGENVGSCGTAAHFGRAVIVSDITTDPLWADFRELALKHGLRACWSVPLKAADGSVLGTFANYYREPTQPTPRDMDIITMVARTASIAIERHRHEQARQRDEEQRIILLREVNHRVKNVFALASALISINAKTASTPKELADSVQARLSALGRAHGLVKPELLESGLPKETTATFRSLVEDILAPYAENTLAGRITIEGRDFPVAPAAITGMALVLHELTTNAVKYGCLRERTGSLLVRWDVGDGDVTITWSENGTPYASPTKSGFGTKLTKATIERQFGGSIGRDWRPAGLQVKIKLPLAALSATERNGGAG